MFLVKDFTFKCALSSVCEMTVSKLLPSTWFSGWECHSSCASKEVWEEMKVVRSKLSVCDKNVIVICVSCFSHYLPKHKKEMQATPFAGFETPWEQNTCPNGSYWQYLDSHNHSCATILNTCLCWKQGRRTFSSSKGAYLVLGVFDSFQLNLSHMMLGFQ